MEKIGEISFKGNRLTLVRDKYKINGRLGVSVVMEDGMPYCKLSCNVVDLDLPDEDCFFVKNWSENAEIAKAVKEAGIFEDTELAYPTGWVVTPI